MPPLNQLYMNEYQTIIDDVTVLLERALKNKLIKVFGIDGFGNHGTSDMGYTYNIKTLKVLISEQIQEPKLGVIKSSSLLYGAVHLYPDGYDSNINGHASTDNNLRISLNELFKDACIDESCWSWADISEQGPYHIALSIDLGKLLQY